MKRTATVVLLLWVAALQSPLVGQSEASQSRFASLWTREAAFSERELLALSKDAEPVARQFAALRLAELDPPSKAALAALVRALGDPAEEVRWQALAGLMRLGRPATRVLAKALSDLELMTAGADFEPMADFKWIEPETGELEGANWPISRADLAFAALVYARDVDVDALLSAYRAAPSEREADEEDIDIEGIGGVGETQTVSPRERIRLVLEQLSPDQLTPRLQAALRSKDPALRAAVEKMMEGEIEDDYEVPISASGEDVAALLKDQRPEVQQAALDRIWNPEDEVSWYDECELLKKSPPGLLVGFPASALSDVITLAREADVPTRRAAVRALGALGCARPELATVVADVVLTLLSDFRDEVASLAAELLADMARQGFLPGSPNTLDAVLAVLTDPKRKDDGEMLTVLQHMELPESRRGELVEILVTACLDGSCSSVPEVLEQRPAWLMAAVDSLVARYPDVQSYDHNALDALEDLGSESLVYIQELERLLDHRSLRLRAAAALAERQISLPRVWQVLEEETLHTADWETRLYAAKALANLGEQGVERLILVARSAPSAMRVEAMVELTRFAGTNSKVADITLAAATDPKDLAQRVAVLSLASLRSRPDEVRVALEKAFSTRNDEVQRAVIEEWIEAGLPPGDLVERAFAEPLVRHVALQLIRLLPQDDPKRLTLTAAALRDPPRSYADAWLEFAGELGEPGAALLAQYASRGHTLTDAFFEGVEHLGSLGGALAPALAARLLGESPEVQGRILGVLAKAQATVDREPLYAQLKAPGAVERERAAHVLFGLQEDPWARGGLLAAVLTEVEVRNIVKLRLADALLLLNPEYFGGGDSGDPTSGNNWPRFPWPPPPGYRRPAAVIPRELLAASEGTTLSDVYKRLTGAVEAAGEDFVHALFLGPGDGFSLMARMERIEANGKPFPEPARWMKEGSPKLSLVDILADLFFEKPGYFREIVFAITDDLAPKPSADASLPELEEGLPGIPPKLRAYFEKPFAEKEVLALVYTFERRPGAKIALWQGDGAPTAEQHLEKAGVLPSLKTAASRRQ